MVPPEQLSRIVDCVPEVGSCGTGLTGTDATAPPHQVAELPEIGPDVVESRLHRLVCPACKKATRAALPPGGPTGAFGPRLLATIALLTGRYRLGKRPVRGALTDLMGLSISTGMVSKAERRTEAATAQPVEEVARAIAASPALNVAETGWRGAQKRAWLWTAVGQAITEPELAGDEGVTVAIHQHAHTDDRGDRQPHEPDAGEGERDLPDEARDLSRAGGEPDPTSAGRHGGHARRSGPLPAHAGPRQPGVARRAQRQRLGDGYESDIRHLRTEIALKEKQLGDFESRLGRPFEHEEYQGQLADLRDRLKLGLSERASEGGEPVADLAERIKALRESVTVGATPERTARKAARAERSVTARVRERLKEIEPAKVEPQAEEVKPEPVQVVEPVQVAAPAAEVITLLVARPVKEKSTDSEPDEVSEVVVPAMDEERGHAGRVSRRRQDDGAQLRLF